MVKAPCCSPTVHLTPLYFLQHLTGVTYRQPPRGRGVAKVLNLRTCQNYGGAGELAICLT